MPFSSQAEGVERLAHRELLHVVRDLGVDERDRVLPPEQKLAHVGHVEEPGPLSHGRVLLHHACVLHRHAIASEGDEPSAERLVLADERGLLELLRHGWRNVAPFPFSRNGLRGEANCRNQFHSASSHRDMVVMVCRGPRGDRACTPGSCSRHDSCSHFGAMARVVTVLTWTAILTLPGGVLLLPVVAARYFKKRNEELPRSEGEEPARDSEPEAA